MLSPPALKVGHVFELLDRIQIVTIHTMKPQLLRILTGIFIACPLIFCGCSSKKAKMNTTTFDNAFQTAPAELKALVAKASKALNDGKLEEGSNTLAEISRKDGLTDAQKDGIRDVVIVIQTVMSEDPDKANIKVHQALEVVMAVLEGRPPKQIGVNPSSLDQPNR